MGYVRAMAMAQTFHIMNIGAYLYYYALIDVFAGVGVDGGRESDRHNETRFGYFQFNQFFKSQY